MTSWRARSGRRRSRAGCARPRDCACWPKRRERKREGARPMPETTPCIITVAITGSLPRKENNPAVPITIAEQVESTQEAFEAGATLAHLHVRNDDGTLDLRPGRVRAPAGGAATPLPRHDPAVLDRRPLRRRQGARRHAGAQARHGLARHRLVQLPDPGLRELARPGRLAGRRDAGARRQAGDRGVRPVDDLQGGRDGAGRQDQGAAARPVRDGREERDAGRSRGVRVLRRDAEAPGARRHLDRRRHRQGPAHAQSLVARARRPLPHRARGQCALGQGLAGAVQRRPGRPRGRAVRRIWPAAGDGGRGARAAAPAGRRPERRGTRGIFEAAAGRRRGRGDPGRRRPARGPWLRSRSPWPRSKAGLG